FAYPLCIPSACWSDPRGCHVYRQLRVGTKYHIRRSCSRDWSIIMPVGKQTTHFPSAARTATPTPVTFANPPGSNHQSFLLTLTVTAASGTGGLTPALKWTDPTNNNLNTIWTGPTVTTVGTFNFFIGPTN